MTDSKKELNELYNVMGFLLQRDMHDAAYEVYRKMDDEFRSNVGSVTYTDEQGEKFDVTHIFGNKTADELRERKVSYIKELREFVKMYGTVTGLKEAKEFVEALIDQRELGY